MRWKASPSELIWKREFETRTAAALAVMPRVVCWSVLLIAYAGLAAILYVPKVPLFDVLSPLALHFLGAGLSAIAALVIARRPILVLLAGTTMTVLGHALPAYLPDRPLQSVSPIAEANARAAPGLRVMAFNLWQRNEDLSLAMRMIEQSGADVVLLSELTPEARRALEAVRQAYPYAVFCPPARPCDQGLLSKIPFIESGAEPSAGDLPTIAWARLAGGDAATGLTVVSTHMTRPTRSFRRHTAQREGLARAVREMKGPVVIGGDLNVTGGTRSYQDLVRDAHLSGFGRSLPTWPAYPIVVPQFGLDHILVGGGAVIVDAGVGRYAGSDHLPVWATIATPPARRD